MFCSFTYLQRWNHASSEKKHLSRMSLLFYIDDKFLLQQLIPLISDIIKLNLFVKVKCENIYCRYLILHNNSGRQNLNKLQSHHFVYNNFCLDV
jgi:hypothetical protein